MDNGLQLLTDYINKMILDSRLKPVHLSLSLALCNVWIASHFQPTYYVSRKILMGASRIRSKTTYHKTIRELVRFGYLKYCPSFHPINGSQVRILMDGGLVAHNNA